MSATKDKIKSMLCVQMMSIIKTDDRNGELCYASFYHEKTVIGLAKNLVLETIRKSIW
jgi:hypothetical protein